MEENTNFNVENCGYDITIGAYNGEEIRRAYGIKSWKSDYEINNPQSEQEENIDKDEYVDLGLPSGTLWATENIKDANGNELYFAWGETQGYRLDQIGTERNFNPESYKFFTDYGRTTKYNRADGKRFLDPEDDAATANLGPDWKIPTADQFSELLENTDMTINDGVAVFTSKVNGEKISFKLGNIATGDVNSNNFLSNQQNYDYEEDNEYYIYAFLLGSYPQVFSWSSRECGYAVRPVRVN